MPTLTATYLDDFARVKLEAGDLDPAVVYSIERSADGGATWTQVRGASNITDGGVTIVYDYEFTPNVENLYQLVAPGISDAFARTAGPAGLYVDGTSGSYASTPSNAAYNISNLSLRADLTPDTWASATVQVYMARYDTATAQRSYSARINNPAEFPSFIGSTDGVANLPTATATAPIPAADGQRIQLNTRFLGDNGAGGRNTTFSTSPMGGSVFTQFGAVVTQTPAATLFASTAALTVGARNDGGSSERLTGIIHSATLTNSGTGTTLASPDFANQPTGTTVFADAQGRAWTVGGSATIVGNDTAWGSTDTGQLWSMPAGTNLDGEWKVAGGAARFTTPYSNIEPPPTWSRYADGATVTDAEATVDIIVPSAMDTPGPTGVNVYMRSTDPDDGYSAALVFDSSTGRVTLTIGGAGIVPTVDVGAFQQGQTWRLRMRTVGTVVSARAWNSTSPEPQTWQVTTTSTAFDTGGFGLGFRKVEGGTGNVEFIVDNVRVTAVPPDAAAEAAVTPILEGVWLNSIVYPSLNTFLGCVLTGPMVRRGRNGIFDVKGTPLPVDIEDVGSTEAFVLTFTTRVVEQNRAVVALLTYGSPLLLQVPPDDPDACTGVAAYPAGWFARGDYTQTRLARGKLGWRWDVPLTRVEAPSSLILPAHMTWQVLWRLANTWIDVWDQWDTWAELWDATVTPDTVYEALMGVTP